MSISIVFRNAAHGIASFLKAAETDLKKEIPVVEHVLDKAAQDKIVVEGVSGAVANAVAPGSGTAVVSLEDALFSIAASIDATLKSGGDAAAQKLLDAGLDVTAITNAKSIGAQTASFYALLQKTA